MAVHPQSDVVSEIARLRGCIERTAAATEITLTRRFVAPDDDEPRSPAAEHRDLCRQLGALRDRVARAEDEDEAPPAVRAELATLLFFATTLQADAEAWRAALDERLRELERRRAAEQAERARLAAERAALVRRRDSLQFSIVETAERMARQNHGECRRTLPVFRFGDGLTVCSVSVAWPRRRLRLAKFWLVTLNDSRDDVLVRRG
jgi:hypothetical protein